MIATLIGAFVNLKRSWSDKPLDRKQESIATAVQIDGDRSDHLGNVAKGLRIAIPTAPFGSWIRTPILNL